MFRALVTGAPLPTLRLYRTPDLSLIAQPPVPALLPARWRTHHVVGIPFGREYPVARGQDGRHWKGRLRAGDVSLHPAGPGEEIRWPEGASCLYLNIHPRAIRTALGVGDETAITLAELPRHEDRRLRDAAMALADALSGPAPRAAANPAAELVAWVARTYGIAASRPIRLGALTLEEVHRMLASDAGQWPRVSQVAQACGLSRAHFTRRFRRLTGGSPGAAAIQGRLEGAKALLGRGESIAAAAHECGFADQSHLTRAFVSAVGTTPLRYRALHESYLLRRRSS